MVERAILPDLRRRSGAAPAILSRDRCGRGARAESALAEMAGATASTRSTQPGNPTIAFLASGIEGLMVRITAKAARRGSAPRAARRRGGGAARRSSATSCSASTTRRWRSRCGALLEARGLDVGRRRVGHRRADRRAAHRRSRARATCSGARSSSYASDVKFDVLGVPAGPVVSAEAAEADGRRRSAGARRRRRARGHGRGRTGRAGRRSSRARSSSGLAGRRRRRVDRSSGCRATASGSGSSPRSRAEPVTPSPHRRD